MQENEETMDVVNENETKLSQSGTLYQETDHLSTTPTHSLSRSNTNADSSIKNFENLQPDMKFHIGKRPRDEEDLKDLCKLCSTPIKDNSVDGICSQCAPSKQPRNL
jgi:hypothetical protein